MRLNFTQTYQSIYSLVSDELPDFVVLTGPNGSGKTHLLRAIEAGHISVDGVAKNGGVARFFDAMSLVPTDTGAFSSATLRQMRQTTLQQLNHLKGVARNEVNGLLVGLMAEASKNNAQFILSDPLSVLIGDINAISRNLGVTTEFVETTRQQVLQHMSQRESEYVRVSGISPGLQKFSKLKNIPLALIGEKDLQTEAIDLWGNANVFQQSLGQLFVAYRDMQLLNKLQQLDLAENRQSDAKALSELEFESQYGKSPWDFVNAVLERAQLPFRINKPKSNVYDDFTPVLTKISNGIEVPFGQLSSGEKVLMSFALCLYQARDSRQAIQYPELILLDEVDAPLHPTMTRHLIETIKEELVVQRGIKVILATHSPTTVALAPDESIFVMRNSYSLKKSSKEKAVRLLTYGIPTLSISFDGRRQVFVESRIDAEMYEKLFQIIKPQFDSEVSLHFIAASGASKSGSVADENGGATVVKNLVSHLEKAGNTSTFGIIDWDKTNISNGRVFVLAEGSRYSLENCIFDPCLVGLKIAKLDIKIAREKLKIAATETYISLVGGDVARMQALATATARALGFEGECVECEYLDGKKLSLPKAMLEENGHFLEDKIKQVFPILLGNYKNTGSLLRTIVNDVAPDVPGWIPKELSILFKGLSTDIEGPNIQ
ncbi:ATPase associated with various cellular activities family protein [Collimonas arenae]|uniref:ATPase associated with various cellular activities family protein n=1 Tax=Collimonas arenae TaxID=279058 RepID=A0A127PUE1_9BURK|nr:ATP-binding protein [Collimonas arenae]AMP01393.1 ATPase associated with various cellular activities family protein [Collimonas arenae]AMP11294.1 ATPase associated with various cellular activities family protein [Collimonas arenae]